MSTEMMELPPDPERMVEGLRDTGYFLKTAVADIVDNSIAADATFVNISLNVDLRGVVTLSVYDNGIGMDREELINAMKLGSKARPSAESLGKFGLGLKTASIAFCRRLVVISRNTSTAPLLRAIWDLDTIKDSNKFLLCLDVPEPNQTDSFEKVIGSNAGTLVIWEKVDRLLNKPSNQSPAGVIKLLSKHLENLSEHFGTVYQRFLDPNDSRATNLKLRLNDQDVPFCDPFNSSESSIVSYDNPEVEGLGGSKARFNIKAYVLPRKEEFSTESAAKLAKISNSNQGIFVYRENRLIHGPDWLGMFSKEPHLSLLRVEFNFDHKLDEAFQIDIKKSQIILNEALYDFVLGFLGPPRRAAAEAYRKGKKSMDLVTRNAHDSSNRNIASKEGDINLPTIQSVDPTTNEVQIINKQGLVTLKLKITSALKPYEIHVQPVDSIDDGVLWEPSLIDGHCGVRINTGHPYYQKVYRPNIAEGVTVQGMDSLLWGISIAELNSVSNTTKDIFLELRYEVSRSLRKLVEDLPDSQNF